MNITYKLSAEHNKYENLTVWDRLQNGKEAGFRINANEGFMFYDSSEVQKSITNHIIGKEMPEGIYYARVRYLPRNYNWCKFSLCAVREEDAV